MCSRVFNFTQLAAMKVGISLYIYGVENSNAVGWSVGIFGIVFMFAKCYEF